MKSEVAIHFRDQFRQARAVALRDAEAFQEIVVTLERFGAFLLGEMRGLGRFRDVIVAEAARSPMADKIPSKHPGLHTPFEVKYELVRKARNMAVHEGALARHSTLSAIELSLILEESLMNGHDRVEHFMVKNPICAYLWQPLSFIRQTMLVNSFSYLPVPIEEYGKTTWRLVSDLLLACYLRGSANGRDPGERLIRTLQEVVDSKEVKLLEAPICTTGETIESALQKQWEFNGLPILVEVPGANQLIGILTSFDLL